MIEQVKTFISTNKKQIIVYSVIILTSFAVGRYTVPAKVKIETKVVEVEKKTTNENKQDKRNTHTETVKTEIKKSDGTDTITTKTTSDTKSIDDTKVIINDQKSTNIDSTKTITSSSSTINLSLLGGASLLHPDQGFLIGGSISTKLIGPSTIGLWGLNNGTAGLSLGLNF